MIKLSSIKPNPKNPRLIKDDSFRKLCDNIKSLPKMMSLRPIVIDDNSIIQGGNQRYKALLELGYKEVPDDWIKPANSFTEEELKQFVILDNTSFGEWEWGMLKTDWDIAELSTWGLEEVEMIDRNVDYSGQNREIQLNNDEAERLEYKLKFSPDEFFDLQKRLSFVKEQEKISTNEQAIFELLNFYERTQISL